MTRLLVISSCTGDKAVKAPALSLDDFSDDDRLSRREAELDSVMCPAEEMYTGFQHVYLMRGIEALRRACGSQFVDLRILSAGYGLISADRPICPYDVTFNNMGRPQARAWARKLGVPDAVRSAVSGNDLVVFLLGSRYLDAVEPPLHASSGQRFVFLAKPSEASRLSAPGVVVVPAGKEQASRYESGLVALKGKMFEKWAESVACAPSLVDATVADSSPATFLEALS